MKRLLLTLAACLLDVYSMEAQSPFPNFTDEQLTAINAIPFGQCKPTVRQIVAHAKKAKLLQIGPVSANLTCVKHEVACWGSQFLRGLSNRQ